jgi:hypothetical protein
VLSLECIGRVGVLVLRLRIWRCVRSCYAQLLRSNGHRMSPSYMGKRHRLVYIACPWANCKSIISSVDIFESRRHHLQILPDGKERLLEILEERIKTRCTIYEICWMKYCKTFLLVRLTHTDYVVKFDGLELESSSQTLDRMFGPVVVVTYTSWLSVMACITGSIWYVRKWL